MNAIYTSITLAYLAKARVLARSVKLHQPDAKFYLVLAEPAPDFLLQGVSAGTEPFDEVVTIDMLGIPNLERWLFGHSVVEACTGVKAPALRFLFRERDASAVLYLDPDTVVFSPLAPLFDRLQDHSIILTPHCAHAETDLDCIIYNEISSLAHGVYNLGFVGVANDAEGCRFADWWCQRLYHFCHDDIPRGLFTDQRWIDLVPAQFDKVGILRERVFNTASWNITQRPVEGEIPHGLTVDGVPLCFYHFSGVNAGVPEMMYQKLGLDNSVVRELIAWYRQQCEDCGESSFRKSKWHYDSYSDGSPITRAQRLYYRERPDLGERFPSPFDASPQGFIHWLSTDGPGVDVVENTYSQSAVHLRQAALQLRAIEQTRAYRLYNKFQKYIPRHLVGLLK